MGRPAELRKIDAKRPESVKVRSECTEIETAFQEWTRWTNSKGHVADH
jgi:hypothetical protein